jgi:hypothetical protein
VIGVLVSDAASWLHDWHHRHRASHRDHGHGTWV